MKQIERPGTFTVAVSALAASLTLAALLAGCECPMGHVETEQVAHGRAVEAEPIPYSPPAAEPSKPVVSGMSEIMPGMSSASMALPTGNKSTSVVYVTKTAPSELMVGKEFDYVIRLTNLTKVGLNNVMLTETLPPELHFKSAVPQARQGDGKLIWDVGDLAGQASKTFTIRAAASQTGTMSGCTDVDYRIPGVCLALRAVQPALRIVKTAPGETLLCDPIPAKIIVTNTGSGTATNVVVTDTLPQGMTTLDGHDQAVMRIGSLGPGQSREYALQARVAKVGRYTGKAAVAADGGLTATSEPVTTTVRTPVLAIKKSGPEVRFVGRPVTYTIAVANMGDAEATDVMLTNAVDVPGKAQFVSASHGGIMQRGTIMWKLGNIPCNESKTVQFTLRPTSLGELRSTATASAYCARDVSGVMTEIKGIPAILLETVDVDDPIEMGANETYVITVTNQGSAIGTGITVHCVLPAAQEFVSASGPTAEMVDGQTIKFAPLRTLAPKARAVYRVVVKGIQAGDVRFKVRLTSDQLTSPVEETESTNIYQ